MRWMNKSNKIKKWKKKRKQQQANAQANASASARRRSISDLKKEFPNLTDSEIEQSWILDQKIEKKEKRKRQKESEARQKLPPPEFVPMKGGHYLKKFYGK